MNQQFKNMLKMVAAPIALSVFLVGCSDASESRVVGTVGDAEITEAQLNKLMTSQYGPEVLDTLMINEIVKQEAKKLKLAVTDEEIEAEYKAYAEPYGGEEGLMEALAAYNMSKEDILADIESYLLTLKVMEDYVAIKDEDVQTYFEENKETFGSAEQVEASHILVEDEATANEVLEKLKAGEAFDTLAKTYSIDESNSEEGGALGFFGRGDMVAEFEEAAFAMNIGDVSTSPVKTDHGYHIIKVTNKQDAAEANFESSKEQAYEQLLQKRVDEQYDTWVTEKQESYEMKTFLFEE